MSSVGGINLPWMPTIRLVYDALACPEPPPTTEQVSDIGSWPGGTRADQSMFRDG